mmetsp:Transcript_14892/g.27931  ORF Transcript_14892/g.27931 Transcript_14892/m.27931 type:complete len:238 (+) Transcript_14892:86-799(+)
MRLRDCYKSWLGARILSKSKKSSLFTNTRQKKKLPKLERHKPVGKNKRRNKFWWPCTVCMPLAQKKNLLFKKDFKIDNVFFDHNFMCRPLQPSELPPRRPRPLPGPFLPPRPRPRPPDPLFLRWSLLSSSSFPAHGRTISPPLRSGIDAFCGSSCRCFDSDSNKRLMELIKLLPSSVSMTSFSGDTIFSKRIRSILLRKYLINVAGLASMRNLSQSSMEHTPCLWYTSNAPPNNSNA